ncbi:MAG: alpha/beta hydrolase family protein [Methyloligellaceae bacterium]
MSEQRNFNLGDLLKPEKLIQLGLSSPLGAVAATSVIDRPTLWAIVELYLPLSRLWAAASAANGCPEAFAEQVPIHGMSASMRSHAEGLLQTFEKARSDAVRADTEWEAAFFGPANVARNALVLAEQRRIERAQALVIQRIRFSYMLMRKSVPPVRFDLASEADVEAAYGNIQSNPEQSFLPPERLPDVEVSRRIPSPAGQDYWIRFRSPSDRVGGTAWARVHEPLDVSDPPTFIFGNGIGVEFDQIRYVMDDVVDLCRRGVRVIEIEAPWHGRRIEPGHYSGEPFLARAPIGAMDLFSAQVKEMAVIIDWCRRTSTGRVGVGGASMGALAAQLAGTHSRNWPERLRPDVLGLITFCDRVHELPFKSALAHKTGLSNAIRKAGWTPESCQRWRGLTDAIEDPAVKPENIIAVLGTEDEITPFEIGKRQVERWGVPESNLFIRRQGHFSVPVGLVRDNRPIRRIAELLCEGG